MTSISTAFTSVTTGTAIRIRPGESFTYVVTGGATATWQIQRKVGSGAWESIATGTGNQTILTVTNDSYESREYRAACTAYTSGTMTVVVADVEGDVLKMPGPGADAIIQNGAGDVMLKATESGVYLRQKPVTIDAAVTITPELHAGRPLVFDIAAGVTATLPAATGTGDTYEFLVGTTVTSVADVIKVANSTDTMIGGVLIFQDGGSTVIGFEASGTDDTITLNGSTTGGIVGDRFILKDIKSGKWQVTAQMSGTGTEATPFSATV